MDIKVCIIDYNAEGINFRLHRVDSVAEGDESHAKSLRGIHSFMHCLTTNFTSDQIKTLNSVLNKQYYVWAVLHLLIMIVLIWISIREIAIKAVSSIPGLIIINGILFSGIAVLAATKRFKGLRYICELFVFFSQMLFEFGYTTSPGLASGAKCAAQMAFMALWLTNLTTTDGPTGTIATGGIIIINTLISITLVFVLHAIAPYETGLGLYMAIMYALGWNAYIIHESFKRVLVRKV
ncbi:hypothetical protein GGI20_004516 [Coemansia sp. BCRC 34301]|nr:hypothetical protein GGI20_004516 [Coemansia sp. BCRC 34301]